MIDYQSLQQQLIEADTDIGASETQGILNGLLCCQNNADYQIWTDLIFENTDPNNAQVQPTKRLLKQLYNDTLSLYQDQMLNIKLLLPDDNSPLTHRLEMLALWANGFLYGLGLGQAQFEYLSKDAKDAIQSFSDFSKIDLDGLVEDQNSEADYMELVEFLRIGTTLIKEDLLEKNEKK